MLKLTATLSLYDVYRVLASAKLIDQTDTASSDEFSTYHTYYTYNS